MLSVINCHLGVGQSCKIGILHTVKSEGYKSFQRKIYVQDQIPVKGEVGGWNVIHRRLQHVDSHVIPLVELDECGASAVLKIIFFGGRGYLLRQLKKSVAAGVISSKDKISLGVLMAGVGLQVRRIAGPTKNK